MPSSSCFFCFFYPLYSTWITMYGLCILCRWRTLSVRLAKQETLTPPGHLVSALYVVNVHYGTVLLLPHSQYTSQTDPGIFERGTVAATPYWFLPPISQEGEEVAASKMLENYLFGKIFRQNGVATPLLIYRANSVILFILFADRTEGCSTQIRSLLLQQGAHMLCL